MELSLVKRTLVNGLRVVVHPDTSAPHVAVHLVYHVGSGREQEGRSGFAHLFEHMLFQGSEHVAKGEHFGLIQAAGGTLNGSTNQDLTRYWERLPANRLDLGLWLESDRMGWLLGAMTQEKLENQRDVVKNEKRQNYDERPYGRTSELVLANLYPAGHPYRHTTIGSMEDIDAATLEDVAAFFQRFYGPNNAVLVIAGDVAPEVAFERAEHWFGDLSPVEPVERPVPIPPQKYEPGLEGVCTVIEDDVTQPELTLCWETVDRRHPDRLAIDLLAEVLSANRASRLDKALSIDARLASHVTIGHHSQERAGRLLISLRPHEGVSLERLRVETDGVIAQLAREGATSDEVEGRKARAEGGFLRALESLEARASALAECELLDGDAAELWRRMERYLALGPAEVQRVCARYLVQGRRVAVVTVPRGARQEVTLPSEAAAERESPERERAPEPGPQATFRAPPVWRTSAKDLPIAGSPEKNLPLCLVRLGIAAGRVTDAVDNPGRALVTAGMLTQGTRSFDAAGWTEALDRAGATLNVSAGDDDVVFDLRAPAHRMRDALMVLEETVLHPRFPAEDFERQRAEHLLHLATRGDRSNERADDAFRALVRGDEPLGMPRAGTVAAVEGLTVEEVAAHWKATLDERAARVAWVGGEEGNEVAELLAPLAALSGKGAERAALARTDAQKSAGPACAATPGIYLVDKPGATQCELRVGHRGIALDHPDFHPLQAANAILGGTFSSRLNMNLRERRGITYGVRSAFSGGATPGVFCVSTAVDAEHGALAVGEIIGEIRGLLDGIRDEEVEFVRDTLSRGLLSTYTSMAARAARLDNVLKYGFDPDYPMKRFEWLANMTRADLEELAARHLDPGALVAVVVGDAEAIRGGLEELDLGQVQAYASS